MVTVNKHQQGASNKDWGALAESIAADYLICKGYVIRERNFRLKNIEIDIIAEKDNHIVFVEVKARNGQYQDPVDAVDSQKRRKMVNGADIYLKNLDHTYFYRFDIITVTGTPSDHTLDHYPDAFLPKVSQRLRGVRKGR